MLITLIDLHCDLVHEWQKLIDLPNIELLQYTDVKSLRDSTNTAFVSPANSLGFMDGGIDKVYSRVMFPGLEAKVKSMIKKNGLTSKLGRPWLPIGEAIVVPVCDGSSAVICAPTMLMPQDVHQTQNAYYATGSALKAAALSNFDRIVFPGMCTGWGKMTPVASALQMSRAIHDFYKDNCELPCREAILNEQPNFYENTEFKNIDHVVDH